MKLVAEHRLRNDPGETRQIESWMKSFAALAQLSPVAQNAFDTALVEWITNIISYGFSDQGEHWITLRCFASDTHATIEVLDEGREFNPLTAAAVDTDAPLEGRPIGGLGIHLIRQLMDSLEYRREAGWNRLAMTRRKH